MGAHRWLCFAAAFSYCGALAQSTASSAPLAQQNYFELKVGGGQTPTPFLGDSDKRVNGEVGLAFAKTERHLRIRHTEGMIYQEAYYEHSSSHGGSGYIGTAPSQYEAFGYLYGFRYAEPKGIYSIYEDVGLGLQYNTHRTNDLPSRLNTTPYLGFGIIIPNRENPAFIGIRLLHSSNGGTVGANGGQNQLFLEFGIKL
ncbi:MAG TPA: acyloxyacyl hydrolase [Fimbriimonadaceae bacterium]|jgi:hypothetical protein